MKNTIHVRFALTGRGFDPLEITSSLGIEPTKTWRYGESIPKTILKFQHDGWELGTKPTNTSDFSPHLEEMITLLEPKLNLIKEITAKLNLNVELCCIIEGASERPGLHFNLQTLCLLVDLNADIDIDIVY